MTAARPGALVFAWFGALLFASSLAVFGYAYLITFGRPAPPGALPRDAFLDVALFSLFAVHHSVFARSGVKALVARTVTPALERSVYTWAASILFIAVCLLWRPVPGELYQFSGFLAIPGYAIQIAGVALTARGSSTLGILDLAGVRGVDPDAADPVALRTSGLYGLVRHPLYLAWVLMVFGTPHMTMTRFVFAAVSTMYIAVAIPFEERGLIRVFGDDYRNYRRKVRWRMLPGVY